MSKKILYIRQNAKGGTDNYCKALYKMFENDAELQPYPVSDIPDIPSRFFHYSYQTQALEEAIRQADIIHINGYTAMGTVQAFRIAKNQNKKIVYTAHWHPFECLHRPFLGKLFFNLFLRSKIKKYAQVVTTINNDDYHFFNAFHPNVVQIPHWFTPSLLKEWPKKKTNMILFVGRIDDPVKGFEHLQHLPVGKYEVHCVGKGKLNRKDFHQHVNIPDEELAKLYAEASLLVIPSKYEAFSYAALEAMTYGTPVLMSERVRIADYLDGVNGYAVFQYGNVTDFIQKIDHTIGMHADVEKVLDIFSIEKIRKQYYAVYLDTLYKAHTKGDSKE